MAGETKSIKKASSPYLIAALIGAAVIAFGFIPIPLTDSQLPSATWPEYSISILPLLPFLILVLPFFSHGRIPVLLAVILTGLIAGVGGLLTFILLAFSGGGTEIVTMHGTALTIALGTSILLISACGQTTKKIASCLFVLPVLVGLWSLAMVPVTYAKAIEISAARPFCIAAHSPLEKELSSLIGLRGLTYYTTLSGYKLGDSWYFHGLLLVDDGGDLEVYNWSPRSMTFHKVERPGSLIASPISACQPRKNFLKDLPAFQLT